MNNKTKRKLLIIGLTFLSVGAISTTLGFTLHQSQNQYNETISSNIEENGVLVRLLSTTEKDGVITKTFTFSITPSNATNQNVTAKAAYKDNSDCSSVLTVSVDNNAKTISVSCKCAFNKQIIVTITSSANQNKSATITCDYYKKVLSLEGKDKLTIGYVDDEGNSESSLSSFDILDMITPQYSIFTKDYDYEFVVENVTLTPILGEMTYCGSLSTTLIKEVENKMAEILLQRIKDGGSYLTSEEIYNLSSNNAWHSALNEMHGNNDDDYGAYFHLTATYKVMEENIYYTYENKMLSASFDPYDGTGTVQVDSVTLELSSLSF